MWSMAVVGKLIVNSAVVVALLRCRRLGPTAAAKGSAEELPKEATIPNNSGRSRGRGRVVLTDATGSGCIRTTDEELLLLESFPSQLAPYFPALFSSGQPRCRPPLLPFDVSALGPFGKLPLLFGGVK